MTIDDFLEKHNMTAYQFAKLTGFQQSQISRFRSGEAAWSKSNAFFLRALDYAIEHGFPKTPAPPKG